MDKELINAIMKGEVNKVISMIEKKISYKCSDNYLDVYFKFSVEYKKVELVNFLLLKGANVNYRNSNGWTSLYIAVNNNDSEMIDILLKNNADVNIPNKDGWGPLFLSIRNKKIQTMNLLIKNGANVNIKDIHGETHLHMSSRFEYEDFVETLIQNGANVFLKNYQRRKPIDVTDKENIKTLLRNAEKDQCIKMFHLFLKLLKSKYDLSILTYFEITKNYSENILNKDEILKIIKIN